MDPCADEPNIRGLFRKNILEKKRADGRGGGGGQETVSQSRHKSVLCLSHRYSPGGAFPGESYTSGQLLSESSKARARTSWRRNDIITIIDPEHSGFVNLRREVESRRQTRVCAASTHPRPPSRSRLIRANPPFAINLSSSLSPLLPPPPWGRRARTTSNIRLATQLYY